MLGDIYNFNGDLPAWGAATSGACHQRPLSTLRGFQGATRMPLPALAPGSPGPAAAPLCSFLLGTHPGAVVCPGSTFSESARLLLTTQKKQEEEQKKKWAEEKKMRTYEGMFTDEAIDAYHAELSDDDFM